MLPPALISHAKLERNVVIVGCCDYVEIWSEELYDKLREDEDISEILEELEKLGL